MPLGQPHQTPMLSNAAGFPSDQGDLCIAEFEDALAHYGQSMTRARPAYTDADGVFHNASTVMVRGLMHQQREFYIHEEVDAGGANLMNDGLKLWLFPPEADVREEDELSVNRWVWRVSKGDTPFVVNDRIVYWVVQVVRVRRVS